MMRGLLIPFLLVACTKNNDPTDTGPSESEVVPAGGQYTISSTLAENGCSEWGPTFNDSIDGFELKITFPDPETATFHWFNPQDCAKNGAEVTCQTDAPLVLDDYAPDSDAIVYYEDATQLNWDTESTATGTWTVGLSCEGTQCELIAEINDDTYPCTIEMDWSLALSE
jgi:hypothetical protein